MMMERNLLKIADSKILSGSTAGKYLTTIDGVLRNFIKSVRNITILLMTVFSLNLYPQGSWNPPGADLSYPRTLLDSMSIPIIRETLTNAEILTLYSSVWSNANAAFPTGNSTDGDRITRAMIAKEAAFIILMDRKYSGGSIITLPPAEKTLLITKTLDLLENINTTVEVSSGLTFYNPWQHRSKELIAYIIAYDLLKGSGISQAQLEASKTRLLTFTANLYQKAMDTYMLGFLWFFTYQFNNHSIMTASALGLAAVVFNNNTSTNVNYQPKNWINAGLFNLDNTLWLENGMYPRVSDPDTLAGYAEGPGYFSYGFENAFPFIRSMNNFLPDGYYSVSFNGTTRSIRNPWFDPRYDRLYDWMNRIRMPDGRLPAIHDSSIGFGTVIIALSGKPQFNWTNPSCTPNSSMFRTQYIATNVAHGPISDSLFQPLPAAGSLIFRSSWQTDAIYQHFIGKHAIALTGAKAHHQGDASSFSLSAFGELMTIDPGYPGASLKSLENKAIDHSLILVDGNGPEPPLGELVNTSTNTAYIENCFDTPLIDYGEVRVSYYSAEIIRKNIFIRNKYFFLADFITSSSPKSYTFQLHGNGLYGSSNTSPTGSFIPDFSHARGIYGRNSVWLLANVQALGNPSSYSYETDSMAISGGFRQYSKMLVKKNQVSNTVFLTALYPYTNQAPQVVPVFPANTVVATRISEGNYRDLIFSTLNGALCTIPSDSSGMNKTLKGNGKINFYSEDVAGSFVAGFIQYGDSLVSNGQTIIRNSSKLDVAWEKIAPDLLGGYVSGSGIVKVFSDVELQPLQGNIASVTYDSLHHWVSVSITGKGNFLMGPTSLSWSWTGLTSSDWHTASNWSMTGHPSVHGIPISSNDVAIPYSAPNMPVISPAKTAACNNLTIGQNSLLTVNSLASLTIMGSIILQGE